MIKSKDERVWLLGGYAALTMILFVWKNHELALSTLPDYDSASNFLVAREIASGNFSNLFRHACPGFNLLLALGFKITQNYLTLEYLNNLVVLGGAAVFARFAAREFKLPGWQELGIFALIGTSAALTHLGRSLSFEPLSFLLFSFFVTQYYRSFQRPGNRHYYTAVLLFALMLTVNYKGLMLIPIILVLEVYYRRRILQLKVWLTTFSIPVLVFVGFALIGVMAGLSPLRYPAVVGSIFFQPDDHPYREFSMFNWDVLFYPRYLFSFENPLLLIGLALFPFTFYWKPVLRKRIVTPELFLLFFAYLILLGMTVIQKAPRGIMLALPLCYILTFLSFRRFISHPLVLGILLLSMLSFNAWVVQKNLLDYSESNYPELAAYLQKEKINKVAVTVSNRIIPLLPDSAEVKVLKHHTQFAELKKEGYEYLIIDDFYRVTCMNFKPEFKRVIKAYREPVMLSPIFILEHCEYSGLSFNEGMALADSLKQKPSHLLLVEL